jgi:hypothetical protein
VFHTSPFPSFFRRGAGVVPRRNLHFPLPPKAGHSPAVQGRSPHGLVPETVIFHLVGAPHVQAGQLQWKSPDIAAPFFRQPEKGRPSTLWPRRKTEPRLIYCLPRQGPYPRIRRGIIRLSRAGCQQKRFGSIRSRGGTKDSFRQVLPASTAGRPSGTTRRSRTVESARTRCRSAHGWRWLSTTGGVLG